ncbi:MAG: LacI family DNA-binding transcriptional regulator [Lachnospiraceae bacterium]|nr:LacI family DNA-binding transcriptional regulator [Lachnospiraceae bacterium]
MRRRRGLIAAAFLILTLVTGCAWQPALLLPSSKNGKTERPIPADEDIVIGVSIWSTVDPLGSECKKMLDLAASALGVRIRYISHDYTPDKVKASVRLLCEAGCRGVVVCNCSDAEMEEIIGTCEENGVYFAQSFREISGTLSPAERKAAAESPFCVGAVHENEEENGEILTRFLLEKGKREIGLIGWRVGDAAWLSRWQGCETAVEKWNVEHPDDKAGLTEPKYGGMTQKDGESAAAVLLKENPAIDAIVVAGGGGEPLSGVIAAVNEAGQKERIDIAATDFIRDPAEYLADGTLDGLAGGTYADPLFAFLAVYRAIKGMEEDCAGKYTEIMVPYMYVVSPDEYTAYKECFKDRLPYTEEEIRQMASMDSESLKSTAAALSVEDVRARIPAEAE